MSPPQRAGRRASGEGADVAPAATLACCVVSANHAAFTRLQADELSRRGVVCLPPWPLASCHHFLKDTAHTARRALEAPHRQAAFWARSGAGRRAGDAGCRLQPPGAGQRGPWAQPFLVWPATSHARFGRSDFPGSFRGTGTSGTEY